MKNIIKTLKKEIRIPALEKASYATSRFSTFEKVVFYIFVGVFIFTSSHMAWQVSSYFMVDVPTHGGTFTEGIVGYPRFINPILALSESDKDMGSLIYSGLLKAMPNGQLINDLAESWKISEDSLTYTFTLKDNVYFHDGKPVTTDDVEFTIQKTQDTYLKSPRAGTWKNVTVNKINNKQINITTKEPYAPFLENFTLGILPKHIWKNAVNDEFPFSQFNSEPIGSGAYKISAVKRNSSGLPVYYKLEAFKNYALGEPYITNLIVRFYPNETEAINAYNSGQIDTLNGISPDLTSKLKASGEKIEKATLPRIFGVFFNQNQATVLANKEVRQALDISVDRTKIINDVLGGYGVPIHSPIPVSITSKTEGTQNTIDEATIETAKKILTDAGWKMNEETGIMEKTDKKNIIPLKFTISTTDTTDLKTAANILKSGWKQIGADVDVKIFEYGDFNQNVVRPRKYDALLFGEIIGRDLDLSPFWHSSNRNDPGLNMALYTNVTADKLLEDAKKTYDPKERATKYLLFEQEVKKDIPAIFLYSPDFIYIVPKIIQNINIGEITSPQERFLDIRNWYINTDKVWKIFAKD